MSRTSHAALSIIVLTVAVVAGCSKTDAVEAPPAPVMAANWKVTSDVSFPPAEVERIAGQLGGDLIALRNTAYEVDGKRVQINTLLAADAASADAIMIAMRKLKPDDFLVRQELVIYEFVVKNEAIAEARAGKAHIEAM